MKVFDRFTFERVLRRPNVFTPQQVIALAEALDASITVRDELPDRSVLEQPRT